MTTKRIISTVVVGVGVFIVSHVTACATVIREDQSVYIIDRTGEKWDITQAVSLGFRPEGFQFGIGRHAIKPLDDRHIQVVASTATPKDARVIGINQGSQAHAYSVSRLVRHEIANTTIDAKPIAAAY